MEECSKQDTNTRSMLQRNLHTVKDVRQQVDASMDQRADALFPLGDGWVSEPHARSLPERSLSPWCERTWPSVSAALADGTIDSEQRRALCVRSVLAELPPEEPVWMAGDGTGVERLEALTSEDRGVMHLSNLPRCDTPISLGWSCSVVGLVPDTPSRWTPPLEIQRISTDQTAIGVAMKHLRRLTPLLGDRKVIVLADRWSSTPDMLRACRELGDSVLIRVKSNRTLSRKPVRIHPRGPFPRDGALVQETRPETQTEPHAVWKGTAAAGRLTKVSRWDDVHVQQDRDLLLSVIRVERTSARDTTRDPRVSWLLTRDDLVPLERVSERSGLRFSEEQVVRFLTQDVLWTSVQVRTPGQFLLWSWSVALAFMQLSLARELGQHVLRSWEAKERPVTPRHVRRVMPSMLSQRGTPARPCHPRGKALGRAKGFHPTSALRHPVV